MKKFLFFCATSASLFFVSCTKSTSTPTPAASTNPNPIEGFWVGTNQIDDAAYLGSFYYAFNIFADSTVIVEGGNPNGAVYTAKGTWTLTKDSLLTVRALNTDLSQPTIAVMNTAVYDSTAGTLSKGVTSYTLNGTLHTGTFLLKRVR